MGWILLGENHHPLATSPQETEPVRSARSVHHLFGRFRIFRMVKNGWKKMETKGCQWKSSLWIILNGLFRVKISEWEWLFLETIAKVASQIGFLSKKNMVKSNFVESHVCWKFATLLQWLSFMNLHVFWRCLRNCGVSEMCVSWIAGETVLYGDGCKCHRFEGGSLYGRSQMSFLTSLVILWLILDYGKSNSANYQVCRSLQKSTVNIQENHPPWCLKRKIDHGVYSSPSCAGMFL